MGEVYSMFCSKVLYFFFILTEINFHKIMSLCLYRIVAYQFLS